MELDIINPFSDYGQPVYGERFLDRRDAIRVVESRVIRPAYPGNLAIVGDYRIGKSSLLHHSIMMRREDLLKKRCLPIWMNLGTFNEAHELFRSLVVHTFEEFETLGWLTDPIKITRERALQDGLSWSEQYSRIQRYFAKVRQAGISVIVVLDEFDHARHLFKGNIAGFQALRELSYNPEWQVTLVTTSRRSLQTIELQTQAISTLAGIFLNYYLGMFDEKGFEEYVARLEDAGVAINEQSKEEILLYCGRHPYLLAMLGYEMVEFVRETGVVHVGQVFKRVEQSFFQHYERIIETLKEDHNLERLVQILFDPWPDVQQADIDELQRYGFIQPSGEGYVAFSEHFHQYLHSIGRRNTDLWSMLGKTEITLRRFIAQKMADRYGEHWVDRLSAAHPRLRSIFEKSKADQQKEEKSLGDKASYNILDFTYLRDLFEIVLAEWVVFQEIFGKDKSYWGQRAQLLPKVRNYLAHHRDQSLHEHERHIAEGYCKEILAILEQHKV